MAQETYEEFMRSLCAADPRLKQRGQEAALPTPTWSPWSMLNPRVVALHLGPENSFGDATEYVDSGVLQAHLRRCLYPNGRPQRSVYILEGLSTEFISVLGDHFQLHPAIFMDHERLVAFGSRSTGEAGGLPFLPSVIHGRDHVSLKYHEPVSLSIRPAGFRNLCYATGRHIAATRLMGKFSEVGIARRKCSFWSRKVESGGWDCLIICDPPITRVLTDYSGNTGYDVMTSPYNAGYVDFMPHKDQMKSRSGPSRKSFLEDLCFYLRTYSNALDLNDPASVRVFAEKLVASQFMKLAEFLQSTMEVVQWNLSRRRDLTIFAISDVEEQWSDIQSWERRIGEYKDDLEAIMLQLRIPLENPDPSQVQNWRDCAADYQCLYMRFKKIGQRVQSLNGSITALASIVGSRQAFEEQELSLKAAERSIREAKSAKALTLLGLVFIPLAYTASLFSMAEPYGPGGERFWLYFVISFPLVGLIMLGYYVLEIGYSNGGMQWSLWTFVRTVEEKFK